MQDYSDDERDRRDRRQMAHPVTCAPAPSRMRPVWQAFKRALPWERACAPHALDPPRACIDGLLLSMGLTFFTA
eukprot:5498460-Pleurochrysis_carterae.AAC.1